MLSNRIQRVRKDRTLRKSSRFPFPPAATTLSFCHSVLCTQKMRSLPSVHLAFVTYVLLYSFTSVYINYLIFLLSTITLSDWWTVQFESSA